MLSISCDQMSSIPELRRTTCTKINSTTAFIQRLHSLPNTSMCQVEMKSRKRQTRCTSDSGLVKVGPCFPACGSRSGHYYPGLYLAWYGDSSVSITLGNDFETSEDYVGAGYASYETLTDQAVHEWYMACEDISHVTCFDTLIF